MASSRPGSGPSLPARTWENDFEDETRKFLDSASPCEGSPPPASTSSGAPRFEALDATRWIASTLIVVSHVLQAAEQFFSLPESLLRLRSWGGTWTQFFFVLSGFALSYVEMTRPEGQRFMLSTREYVKKRLITIYPTYIFAVVLTAFQRRRSLLDWLTLPLHILLLQSWVPLVYPAGNPPFEEPIAWTMGAGRWCQTSWFISVLMLYWIFLAPCATRIHRLSLRGCLTFMFACWSVSLLFLLTPWLRSAAGGPGSLGDALVYTSFQFAWPGYVHVFLFGIAASRLFILISTDAESLGESPRMAFDTTRAPWLLQYGCSVGFCLFAVSVAFAPTFTNAQDYGGYMLTHNGGLLPLMLLIILGAAGGRDPLAKYVLATPVFVVLGRISYAQYLLHVNIGHLVLTTVGTAQPLELFLILPVAVFAGSYLTDRCFTQPYSEWLRRK